LSSHRQEAFQELFSVPHQSFRSFESEHRRLRSLKILKAEGKLESLQEEEKEKEKEETI
jgi:hypothetical protein